MDSAIYACIAKILINNHLQEQYKANKSIAALVHTKILVYLQQRKHRGVDITTSSTNVTISIHPMIAKELADSFIYGTIEGRKVRDGYLPCGYPPREELFKMYPNPLGDEGFARDEYNSDRFE